MENSLKSGSLFASFAPTSRNDWMTVALSEVDGKNPFEALQWTLGEIKGSPYYDQEDNDTSPIVLPPSTSEFMGPRAWRNMPVINALEEKKANEKALHYLRSGADGILFDTTQNNTISFSELLHLIEWPHCSIGFYLPDDVDGFFDALSSYLSSNNSPEKLNGFFLKKTYPHHPQSMHKVIHTMSAYSHLHFLGINTTIEDPVDQINDLLLNAVTLIDQLTELESAHSLIMRNLFFSVPVGTDFFAEIAKLKALRLLWFQVLHAYGIHDRKLFDVTIHAYSEPWKKELFQPHENMLKGTMASLASILGGCNALSVHPDHEHDERLSRIARNVSSLLREESYLNKVADPTAGSYYVDTLVKEMAEKAWTKFIQSVTA
jgi:methylmalonyl-CoA mutase